MAVDPNVTYLTAEQAAKVAGCTPTWIRKLLKAGRLEGVQVCGWTWLIDEQDALAIKKNLSSRAVSKRDHEPKKAKRKAG